MQHFNILNIEPSLILDKMLLEKIDLLDNQL